MHRLAIPLIIPLFLLFACSSDAPDDASPQVLNSTAFVKVADRVFSVPVAEIETVTQRGDCNCISYAPDDEDRGRSDSEKLAQDAGHKSDPIDAGYIKIRPGHNYERSNVNSGCQFSSVSWKCLAKRYGVPRDLPSSFIIADVRFIKQFTDHFTVGGERVADHLANLTPIASKTSIACDTISRFCTAAFELSPHVMAIWDVWSNDRTSETAIAMAKRQGRAISVVANGS